MHKRKEKKETPTFRFTFGVVSFFFCVVISNHSKSTFTLFDRCVEQELLQ